MDGIENAATDRDVAPNQFPTELAIYLLDGRQRPKSGTESYRHHYNPDYGYSPKPRGFVRRSVD